MKNLLYLSITLAIAVSSCTEDKGVESLQVVKLRLPDEPDRIHPMLSNSSYATQVENFIFLPMLEFDPVDLSFTPVLAETLPEETAIETGKFAGGTTYSYQIKKDATWADGKPVLAEDYLFTIKAALNPHCQANTWRSFLNNIDSVILYEEDPKKFDVIVGKSYMLARTTTANFSLYPKHFYDSRGLMDDYRLSDLRVDSVGGKALRFAQDFRAADYSRKRVMGCGAYKLTLWDTQKSLTLEKRSDWWGDQYQGTIMLQANPEKLEYFFIPDETTAITLLKDGQLDIVSGINPTMFAALQEEAENLNFHTPAIMQYYYLALNNQKPALRDKRVRLALSHTLDIAALSRVLMHDLARPITGPIHPSKDIYNNELKPIPFDLGKASKLLAEAGWTDSDGDKILDKQIEGKTEKLSLTIYVSQKELGKNIARIFKENAAKVGVEINIDSREWGYIRKRLASKEFDIVAMATRQSPDLVDLHQSWHTSSIGPGGRNVVGFGNAISDSIIEQIRITKDADERKKLYHDIQRIIYEEQPMIFLFAPTETIAVSDKIDIIISPRRPGYFENTAKFK